MVLYSIRGGSQQIYLPAIRVLHAAGGHPFDGTTYDGLPLQSQPPVLEQSRRLAAIAEFERLYQPVAASQRALIFPE